MNPALTNLAYIVAAILFVFGIKMLGRAETARSGNRLSALGMLIAIVATLAQSGLAYEWIAAGLALGAIIGVLAARLVRMTAMPEMVALFNGFGGLASLLVGWAELEKILHLSAPVYFFHNPVVPTFTWLAIALAVAIGGMTFTGSILAWGKLSGKFGSKAVVFSAQRIVNSLLLLAILVAFAGFVLGSGILASTTVYGLFLGLIAGALLLGILAVLPIGGGDMPVVIALLNSLSGLAAAAAGFVIFNNVLIVAGALVGCSGLILTIIMCKAMNRSLPNVLFSGFGAVEESGGGDTITGEMKAASLEDAYYVLEAASSVVIIPGYGMAVAQAQHAVKELGDLLEANGATVRYAIHPVAGRMPGHMNVLLAEADVPYEQLCEMEAVNPIMGTVDVAIVIGANDVVNPAAVTEKNCPIYGMPIINAHQARTVFALKRGKGAGFSGLVNQLYFLDKTRMLYGDAKSTVTGLVAEFKSAQQ